MSNIPEDSDGLDDDILSNDRYLIEFSQFKDASVIIVYRNKSISKFKEYLNEQGIDKAQGYLDGFIGAFNLLRGCFDPESKQRTFTNCKKYITQVEPTLKELSAIVKENLTSSSLDTEQKYIP